MQQKIPKARTKLRIIQIPTSQNHLTDYMEHSLEPIGEPYLCKNQSSHRVKATLCGCSVCPTLCNPMDCSPPGSSVHGILQARILEWVAVLGALPDPGIEPMSPALQADSSPSESPGKP